MIGDSRFKSHLWYLRTSCYLQLYEETHTQVYERWHLQGLQSLEKNITSCYFRFVPTKYVQHQNNLCKYVHMLLARKYDLLANDRVEWYTYPVLENEHAIRFCRLSSTNTPHGTKQQVWYLSVRKNERHAIVIDIAVPSDHNILREGRRRNPELPGPQLRAE